MAVWVSRVLRVWRFGAWGVAQANLVVGFRVPFSIGHVATHLRR